MYIVIILSKYFVIHKKEGGRVTQAWSEKRELSMQRSMDATNTYLKRLENWMYEVTKCVNHATASCVASQWKAMVGQ